MIDENDKAPEALRKMADRYEYKRIDLVFVVIEDGMLQFFTNQDEAATVKILQDVLAKLMN